MKRKIRSMLSTALIVSMLGTMFGGTAFGAKTRNANGLFEGNETPFLMWTDSAGYGGFYDARELYSSKEVELASPANALMASDSDALAASPSEALSLKYNEIASSLELTLGGHDSESWDDFYAWKNSGEPSFPRKINLSTGEGENRYQGEVEVRLNWFFDAVTNDYSTNYDRIMQTVDVLHNPQAATPSCADAAESGDYKFSFQEVSYIGDERGTELSNVTIETDSRWMKLNFSNTGLTKIDADRKTERYIRVDLKKDRELLGYTYVILPRYSEINGKTYISVTDYLEKLGDEKNSLKELKITQGDITADEWQNVMNLPALEKLYLSDELHLVDMGYFSERRPENTHLKEIYFNWDENAAAGGPTKNADKAPVKSVLNYNFKNCTNLKIASLPGVRQIGADAFKGDTSLTDLITPDVTSVSDDAFLGCTSLEKVELPSAETMGSGVFEGCTALETIEVPSVTFLGERALKDCTALKEIELLELETIGDNAFENCKLLTELSLPSLSGFSSQGASAFKNCTSLVTADMPKLRTVPSRMFEGCTSLRTVKISDADYVNCDAFTGLSNQPENRIRLYLPADDYPYLANNGTFEEDQRFTYTFIDWWGNEVTGADKRVAEQHYANNEEWQRVLGLTVETGERGNIDVDYQIAGIKSGKSGNSLSEIFDQIHRDGQELSQIAALNVYGGRLSDADWKELPKLTGLQMLEVNREFDIGNSGYETGIPKGVKMPKSLQEATLYTVTNIPAGAFENCTALESVRMDSVTYIGDKAFAGCTSLKKLIMPTVPPTLGKNVFEGCTSKIKDFFLARNDDMAVAKAMYTKADAQWLPWFGESGGTTPTPTPPSGGSSSSGRDRGTHYGSWMQDASGNWYYTFNNFRPVSQWGYLPYNGTFAWYYFDQNGNMLTGWYTDEFGRTYYLHPLEDGSRGHMYTGWNEIDGKWYYFSTKEGAENGMLLKNTTTPDGCFVDADGVRVQ